MTWQHRLILALFFAVGLAARATAADLPAWTAKIRGDHPRLFFNADTWPAVRDRALRAELAWYRSMKARVDRLSKDLAGAARATARAGTGGRLGGVRLSCHRGPPLPGAGQEVPGCEPPVLRRLLRKAKVGQLVFDQPGSCRDGLGLALQRSGRSGTRR